MTLSDLIDLERVMRFDPLGHPDHPTNWWAISPGAVITMLKRCGFPKATVTRHSQVHHVGHRLDEPAVPLAMYTVVAERE